jgi:hypothetical protein
MIAACRRVVDQALRAGAVAFALAHALAHDSTVCAESNLVPCSDRIGLPIPA